MERKRLLVMDFNSNVLSGLQARLPDEKIDHAYSVPEAEKLVKREGGFWRYDLILTNPNMPPQGLSEEDVARSQEGLITSLVWLDNKLPLPGPHQVWIYKFGDRPEVKNFISSAPFSRQYIILPPTLSFDGTQDENTTITGIAVTTMKYLDELRKEE